MTIVQLDGRAQGQLARALQDAFTPQQFQQLLKYELNKNIHSFASLYDDYPTQLYKVIESLDSHGVSADLILAARVANPRNPALQAVAMARGLSPQLPDDQALQRILQRDVGFVDLATFHAGVARAEACVCRIEIAQRAVGTGFLIGTRTVMTNAHVIEPVLNRHHRPAEVIVRFDYKMSAGAYVIRPGTTHTLADDWHIESAGPSGLDIQPDGARGFAERDPDELDYALLRLSAPAAEDALGRGPTADRRGFLGLDSQARIAQGHTVFIVQHPDGAAMTIAVGQVSAINANHTRVRYSADTDSGSSGSPCFNARWDLVALHHAGDPLYAKFHRPTYNQGIPIAIIRQRLAQSGRFHHLMD
ncbi:MAG: trypsin-like peptidase domain-containing protein [Proteobacteria bacterium]|nr:trypsin-like peptidase domain-containing protein [Pseudomonadota bacterium]